MSHHIYHTRGIILGSRATGESNRFYKIFTEELGLVGATAQSVRVTQSKLRFVLQDFSLVTVDLVRGKEMWRIISAGAWQSLQKIKSDPSRMKLLAQFFALLSRLLHGEGRDQELFAEIVGVTDFLEKETVPPALELSFETLVALRTLIHLGYMDREGYEQFLEPGIYSVALLEAFEKIRTKVLPKINEALNATHL